MTGSAVPKLIAFNLPQFHPIPENDTWWGKGFTEWTNVVKGKPLFEGHYQPHLPADLGFYDLRLPEAREAQAALAREYGIHGFCYYHYWFNGKRLLERPVNEILASGKPDFPFCLCWANELWSRGWLGEKQNLLQGQAYSCTDDKSHSAWLARVFGDRRYIRFNGRPIFLLFNVPDHPTPARFCGCLRDACLAAGEEDPYLIGVDGHCAFQDTRRFGFDTTLHFEPQLSALPECFSDKASLARWRRNLGLGIRSGRLKVYDYRQARRLMNSVEVDFPSLPCVLVGWDNTPRRGRLGSILVNNSPEAFRTELETSLLTWLDAPRQDDLFFLNAWNEWAEGNHLEPDRRFGLGYLQAVKDVLSGLEATRRVKNVESHCV